MKAIRNGLLIAFIGVLLMACQGRQQGPKIEIFLTKKRLPTTLGEPYSEENTDSTSLAFLAQRYDLSSMRKMPSPLRGYEPVFAGPFEATIDDLETPPFIANENIIGFNDAEAQLVVDSIGERKLYSLPNKFPSGRQFVLTVNGAPKLSGYFINMDHYQGGIFTNSIRYINRENSKLPLFVLHNKSGEITLKSEQPELYQAFKQSDRILADDKNL